MLRAMIPMVLTLSLISLVNPATAFTVRFGAAPIAEDPVARHGGETNDILTPRMLNMAVGTDGVTFGAQTTPTLETPPVPTIQIHRNEPPLADAQTAAPVRKRAMPRQLSGAEMMLLRGAKQVAER